jgi:hypothetical protein
MFVLQCDGPQHQGSHATIDRAILLCLMVSVVLLDFHVTYDDDSSREVIFGMG